MIGVDTVLEGCYDDVISEIINKTAILSYQNRSKPISPSSECLTQFLSERGVDSTVIPRIHVKWTPSGVTTRHSVFGREHRTGG